MPTIPTNYWVKIIPTNWVKIIDDNKGGLTYFYPDGKTIHVTKEELKKDIYK
jgi:hypothetical protein